MDGLRDSCLARAAKLRERASAAGTAFCEAHYLKVAAAAYDKIADLLKHAARLERAADRVHGDPGGGADADPAVTWRKASR